MKTLIAIDLGTKTGWAVYRDGKITSGTWQLVDPKRKESAGYRYWQFELQLMRLIRAVTASNTPISCVYFEEVRRHLGTEAAHVYGGLRATLYTVLDKSGIPYASIPVATIKQAATGKGNAPKDLMLRSAQEKWPEQNVYDDNQADALWILETAIQKERKL